uniref:Uncharacterized protein n=1 Tax=Meloidogyne floridensis TaxID=298350 RepID=A0A915NPS2_9BILA
MGEVATEQGVELTAEEKNKKDKEEKLRKQIGDIWTKIREQFKWLKDIEDTIDKDQKLPTLPQRNLHRLSETKDWRDFTKKQFKVVSVFLKDTFYDDFDSFYDDFGMDVGVDKSVEILTALRTFLKGISSLLVDYVDYYKECFPRNTRTVTWDVEA